jgi:hypothetical protein
MVCYMNDVRKDENTGMVYFTYFIFPRNVAEQLQWADQEVIDAEKKMEDLKNLNRAAELRHQESVASEFKSIVIKKNAIAGERIPHTGQAIGVDYKVGCIYEQSQVVGATPVWSSRDIQESLSLRDASKLVKN